MVSDSSCLVFSHDVRAQHTRFPPISFQSLILDFHKSFRNYPQSFWLVPAYVKVHSSSDGSSLVYVFVSQYLYDLKLFVRDELTAYLARDVRMSVFSLCLEKDRNCLSNLPPDVLVSLRFSLDRHCLKGICRSCLLADCFDQLFITYIGLCMNEERRRSSIDPVVPILIGLPPPSQQGYAFIIVQTYVYISRRWIPFWMVLPAVKKKARILLFREDAVGHFIEKLTRLKNDFSKSSKSAKNNTNAMNRLPHFVLC